MKSFYRFERKIYIINNDEQFNKMPSINIYSNKSKLSLPTPFNAFLLEYDNKKLSTRTQITDILVGFLNYVFFNPNNSIDLHSWLHMQKQRQRKGQLKPYQIYKLELLGIQWIKKKEKKISEWDKYYVIAEKFYNKYGHLLISRSYVTHNGVELGKWVNEQRDNHWGIGRRVLKKNEYDKLSKIGMYWESLEQGKWEFFLKMVQEYNKEHSFPIEEDLIYKYYPLGKQLKFYLGKQEKVRELQRILPNNSK